ncbi:MAG: hypothetical protein AAGI23_01370 [Bacteroidota bacterium]
MFGRQLSILLILSTLLANGCGTGLSIPQDINVTGSIFYPDVLSTEAFSENSISFTKDERTIFVSRTTGWQYQSGHLSKKQKGAFVTTTPIQQLDSIYNGAISPSGKKIIFCSKKNEQEEIFLLSKRKGKWNTMENISTTSDIYGGYFYWSNEEELYFYTSASKGDIVRGKLNGNQLTITDELDNLNTPDGTEFSPFVDKKKRYIIFTRYLEGDSDQQGFFISFNRSTSRQPDWSTPKKVAFLPYGWNAYVLEQESLLLYSNGDDIIKIPLKKFNLEIDKIRNAMTNDE